MPGISITTRFEEELVHEMNVVAKYEHRKRCELIREAVRQYCVRVKEKRSRLNK